MSERISANNRIIDHAFVLPESGEDKCGYDKCEQPELSHEWTVGARVANPSVHES
jgi:hypothetical protein